MAGMREAWMPSPSLHGCIHGGPRDASPTRDPFGQDQKTKLI